jgi:antitoxin component YwqK of YwqJK toxin-antitoxin module
MKMYRFLFLLLLFHFSPDLSAQDTTRIYYGSGKLRGLDIKLDSTHVWERAFYESGRLEAEITAQILPGSEKHLIEAMKTYYEDGVLKDLINDSVEIRYEQDGSIFQHSVLKGHRKNGLSCTYLDHRLWLEVTYKDNKKEGWLISFDSAQRIVNKTFYRNDQQSGPTLFYRKGILVKAIEDEKGCPVKAEYFDVKGHLLRTVIDKKDIWMEEGKPAGCR